MRAAIKAATQPAAGSARRPLARDPNASGRAQSAFQNEWDKVQGEIDAIMCDPSLTREQRGIALVALRQRQAMSAAAARKRVLEEERAAARARRRALRPPRKPRN